MKNLIGALVTALALAFSGMAHADELMESTFGNTVAVADADGAILVSYHFAANNTFHLVNADGTDATGSWILDGNNLCLTQGEETNCTEIEDRQVGDSWEVTDDDGNTMTISIVEGH